MKQCLKQFVNGLIKENPTFVLMLGMCPTLATTTSATNAVGMGLTTTVVLVLSNILISMLRKVIPDKVRIPAFIVVIASFVTIVEFLLKAYLPGLNESLGIYIPLIVVNCIILGRAEAFASKNPVLPSAFDGIGMGLGFTLGLTCIGVFRELLGAGEVFGIRVMPASYEPLAIFVMAPGAFFVLAMLTALQNKLKLKSATNVPGGMEKLACGGNCAACNGKECTANHALLDQIKEKKAAEEAAKKEALIKAAAEKKAAAEAAAAGKEEA
ncbi:MAG: electron transport complex subunit E [Lachnospiraceae bacterium]|nr:electron transport complex subunit E [Lachnospiraceae bacterium]